MFYNDRVYTEKIEEDNNVYFLFLARRLEMLGT